MGENSQSGGAYYNVIRNTRGEEEKERILREIAERKGSPTCIRLSLDELAMVEIIRRATGAPNRSESIRHAIRVAYGLVAGAESVEAGKVVVQSPIVNLNINNNNSVNKNEVKLQIPQELMKKLDGILELLEFMAFKSAYPASIKKRAEEGYQVLRRLKKIIVDMN